MKLMGIEKNKQTKNRKRKNHAANMMFSLKQTQKDTRIHLIFTPGYGKHKKKNKNIDTQTSWRKSELKGLGRACISLKMAERTFVGIIIIITTMNFN